MSAYQMVIRSTGTVFQGFSVSAMYERFLNCWVTLYADAPRNPRPLI